jgi:hypothetical protein
MDLPSSRRLLPISPASMAGGSRSSRRWRRPVGRMVITVLHRAHWLALAKSVIAAIRADNIG